MNQETQAAEHGGRIYRRAYGSMEASLQTMILNRGLSYAFKKAKVMAIKIYFDNDEHYLLIDCPNEKGTLDACIDFIARHKSKEEPNEAVEIP